MVMGWMGKGNNMIKDYGKGGRVEYGQRCMNGSRDVREEEEI